MDRTVTAQGRRSSTARGYLDVAKQRPNLTIITHAQTDRILFSGKTATGVCWLKEGKQQQAEANREVLLCAGAIASPQILQRSGVGPEEWLRELDIDMVHALPGVGHNLQDHLEVYMQFRCKKPVSLYPSLHWWNQPAIGAEWLFNGTGIGPVTSLKPAALSAAMTSQTGRICSITSCRWRLTTTAAAR